MKPVVIVGALVALAAAAFALQQTSQAFAATGSSACFMNRDWTGSKAADEHTLYIKVRHSTVYRIDFKQGCSRMDEPWAKFITISRGAGAICHPNDLDIKVSSSPGVVLPCLATGLHKLTDAEAKALPVNLQP